MPIVVRVVSEADFNTWIAQAKQKFAGADSAPQNVLAAAGTAAR
jgi:heme/copper-type cytochrome/quinol oxidase subunit 2